MADQSVGGIINDEHAAVGDHLHIAGGANLRGGDGQVFREIYQELVLIRKELQAIRSSMESNSGVTIKKEFTSESIRGKGTVKHVNPNRFLGGSD